jgi:hypothetical protein
MNDEQLFRADGTPYNPDVYGTVPRIGLPTTNLNEGGLFSNLTNNDYLNGAFGVGQLGLGLFNALENRKVRKAQVRGLNEQIANSRYARNAHKDFVSNVKAAFAQ